jgi:hypothetical protein
VTKYLPIKCEALSSNPTTAKNKNKKKHAQIHPTLAISTVRQEPVLWVLHSFITEKQEQTRVPTIFWIK